MCTLRGMRKSSVYLPAGLKERLAQAAARSGISEAAFIRDAIEAALDGTRREQSADAPSIALKGPLLVGVGVGPGAPDLLTSRARAALRRADAVFAAAISSDAIGRAETTVRAALGPLRIERLPVDVRSSRDAYAESLPRLATRLLQHLDRGDVVAFVTIGDPNMFSIFPSVAAAVRRLRPNIPTMTVAGIMAFQELAARSGTVIGDHEQSVRILAAGEDEDRIADSLSRPNETLVLYRGGRQVPAIARRLTAAGRSGQAVVGELLGMPGERWASATDFLDQPASYLASLIAPAADRR